MFSRQMGELKIRSCELKCLESQNVGGSWWCEEHYVLIHKENIFLAGAKVIETKSYGIYKPFGFRWLKLFFSCYSLRGTWKMCAEEFNPLIPKSD